MKQFVFAVFALTAVAIAALLALKPRETPDHIQVVTPQVVNVHDASVRSQGKGSASDDTAATVSFISLQQNEVLLQALSVDFDGDGNDDQINSIRRGADPEIILLVGLYNPAKGSYERVDEIKTEITQPRTFSYTCIDITGTHRNALMYQGFLPSGDSVMRIFHCSRTRSGISLSTIGDFRSDGTIFIQRVDRYDSYETLGGLGTSYPVWVYSSDSQSGEQTQSLDQLQTMYDWDSSRRMYVRVRQTRVTGQRLAQSEIQRIQDGTVATFARFLEGLWYKAGADNASYVFFDYANREVTFYSGSSQEVYSWEGSTLRRNGIYLSTVNTSISNLSRLVDVSLSGSNEIKLRIQDDVRMLINEDAAWNGAYVKISRKNENIASNTDQGDPSEDIFNTLTRQQEWTTGTGESIRFIKNNYTLSTKDGGEEGRFSLIYVFEKPIIEFRAKTASAFFEKTYHVIRDGASFILEPVAVSPTRIAPGNKPEIRLDARE
ncbi:MAG: hypothetical protein Pg6C_08720 [Treponemataceae bacterium]|nr:MAG: hypothetical protein Pg6C_08720 [Treponemataceae bacterium]